jgi:hypothetical protein
MQHVGLFPFQIPFESIVSEDKKPKLLMSQYLVIRIFYVYQNTVFEMQKR